jgi:hypothetical protein
VADPRRTSSSILPDIVFSRDKAYLCVVEPIKETGALRDEVEDPARHPKAADRLTAPPRRPISRAGGELPGRKTDGRRYAFFFSSSGQQG